MEIIVSKKEELFKGVINVWLHEQELYCNWCDKDFDQSQFPCCDNPQVGRNIDHCKGVISENARIKETLKNEFGATESKSMRYGINMPPRLYTRLNQYMQSNENKSLFKTKEDIRWFMRKFPQFTIAEKI